MFQCTTKTNAAGEKQKQKKKQNKTKQKNKKQKKTKKKKNISGQHQITCNVVSSSPSIPQQLH